MKYIPVDRGLGPIRGDIHNVYLKLCGEYPGSVTIRHTYDHFEKLRALDFVSDVSSAFGKYAKHCEFRPDIIRKLPI
jgi:hypothetical protein